MTRKQALQIAPCGHADARARSTRWGMWRICPAALSVLVFLFTLGCAERDSSGQMTEGRARNAPAQEAADSVSDGPAEVSETVVILVHRNGTLEFDPPVVDFGDLPAGDTAQATVQLSSSLGEPVQIQRTKSSCSCVRASIGDRRIVPGQPVDLHLALEARGRPGAQLRKIIWLVFAGGSEPVPLEVTAQIAALSEHSGSTALLVPKGNSCTLHTDNPASSSDRPALRRSAPTGEPVDARLAYRAFLISKPPYPAAIIARIELLRGLRTC